MTHPYLLHLCIVCTPHPTRVWADWSDPACPVFLQVGGHEDPDNDYPSWSRLHVRDFDGPEDWYTWAHRLGIFGPGPDHGLSVLDPSAPDYAQAFELATANDYPEPDYVDPDDYEEIDR